MVLIIDNYDSFTYNLVHYVEELTDIPPQVMRNDAIDFDKASEFSHIILSPGPGLPEESGDLMRFIQTFYETKKILGVCLGHQALAQFFGARLKNMNTVRHGVSSQIKTDTVDPLYAGLPPEIAVARYHSWVVDAAAVPACIQVTAWDEEEQIMSFRHTELSLTGIQYHPESVLTPYGKKIMQNWLMESEYFR